ncbi:MAG: hypothetical protein Q8L52_01405 [bacterium]|nr:hypothetical protein [bacterium]
MKSLVRFVAAMLLVLVGILPAYAQSVDTPPPSIPPNLVVWQPSVANGWTLLGNPHKKSYAVADLFGSYEKPAVDADGNKIPNAITSVWKWVGSGWEFYSPLLTSSGNTAYAASKRMSVLSVIKPGEGFWVNSRGSHLFPEMIAEENAGFYDAFKTLSKGWQLVAPPRETYGRELNQQLSSTPVKYGAIPTEDITSMWVWNPWPGKWAFYAPTIDATGDLGATQSYADARGYYDLTNWYIQPGMGVWINKKSGPASMMGLMVRPGPIDPVSRNIIAGESHAHVGQFSLTAQNSSKTIRNLAITVPAGTGTSITNMTLQYRDVNGVVQNATAYIVIDSNDLSGVANFAGLATYIPINDSANLDVFVGTPTIASGAMSGAAIKVGLKGDTGSLTPTGFRAVDSNGIVSTEFSATTAVSGGTFYVRKSIPMLSAIALDTSTLSSGTNKPIARFKTTADAAGDVGWNKIVFAIKRANVAVSDVRLWQGSNLVAGNFTVTPEGLLAFVPYTEQTVLTGSSVIYELRATVGVSAFGVSSLEVSIPNTSVTSSTGIAADIGASDASFVWSDRSSINTAHSLDTDDWTNDFLVPNLPLVIGNTSSNI